MRVIERCKCLIIVCFVMCFVGNLWLFLNQVFLGSYGFYDVSVYGIYGFYARVSDEFFWGFFGVLEGFWKCFLEVFFKVFLCVLKIFFCEVSVTTIPLRVKYEQIVNVKYPPCKYRKYFNFLIWAIKKLTVSHF